MSRHTESGLQVRRSRSTRAAGPPVTCGDGRKPCRRPSSTGPGTWTSAVQFRGCRPATREERARNQATAGAPVGGAIGLRRGSGVLSDRSEDRVVLPGSAAPVHPAGSRGAVRRGGHGRDGGGHDRDPPDPHRPRRRRLAQPPFRDPNPASPPPPGPHRALRHQARRREGTPTGRVPLSGVAGGMGENRWHGTHRGCAATPPTRAPDLADDFTNGLRRDLWSAHYLPHWTTPDRSAARMEHVPGGLALEIEEDQPDWRVEDAPLRVSSLQTGTFSGPLGSTRGTHRHRPDGLHVRTVTPTRRLWAPSAGRIDLTVSATRDPGCMLAAWLVGTEHLSENAAGEVCIFEIGPPRGTYPETAVIHDFRGWESARPAGSANRAAPCAAGADRPGS